MEHAEVSLYGIRTKSWVQIYNLLLHNP
jgi:hypothetical protein